MTGTSSRSPQIQIISHSLICIMLAICVFQLVSYGLVIERAVNNYRQALSLKQLDSINRDLFIATDQLAREHNLYQSLLSGNQPITPEERAQLLKFRQQANQSLERALSRLSLQPDISAQTVIDPLKERWQHFRQLRTLVDKHLSSNEPGTDETLAYQLSLASSDLTFQAGLAVHELTRKLASAPDESIGRLAEADYLLWQVRNQVAKDGAALIARAQLGHILNTSDEAALEAGRELAANAMVQLQTEMHFLGHYPLGYHTSDLALELARFQDLSAEQVKALSSGKTSPLVAAAYRQKTNLTQDHLLTLFRRLSDSSHLLVTTGAQAASDRLLRYVLFLCVAITLNLLLLTWLRRRVLQPLHLLSKVQDAAREAIVLVDEDGRIITANTGTEMLFAISAAKLDTLDIRQLLPDIALDRARLRQLASSGDEVQTRARRSDGNRVHVSLIASPLSLSFGKLRDTTLLIIRDDQERFQAEEANRHNLEVLSEMSRIQGLLFTQAARQRVFGELLDIFLNVTGSDAGCLLEMRDDPDGQAYRCRAGFGMEEAGIETGSIGMEHALLTFKKFDSGWQWFPVSLQGDLSGLVILRRSVSDRDHEVLESLLSLYASVLGFVTEEEWRKQSAAQLHDVLRQQEALFSASPAGLIQIDTGACIVRSNSHVSQIFGRPEDVLIDMNLETLLNAPGAWRVLSQRITRIKEGRQAAACELECRNSSGGALWVLFEIRALYADRPEEGMILSCIDITTLKSTELALREARDKAAEARGQLIAAIEAIPEAFAFYDVNDQLVICNQHYANLFFGDMTTEQMIGKTFESLVRFSLEHAQEHIEEGFDAEAWVIERVRRHHQQLHAFVLQIGERWYQAADHQIPGLGSVCLRSNVTELKAQEQELRQAKIKADDANRAKSAFLASISHEIRTPLNGILGLLELLRLTELDQSQQETLISIQDSAYTLLRLIDDILDFSKIEAGKLDLALEPVAVGLLMTRVQELYQELAAGKGLDFQLEIDPALAARHTADPLRLRQILQNFVSNAIKFTQDGAISLQVQVLGGDARQQTLRFACIDSGIGISADSLNTLFRPFTQAESSTTRRFGGTGLGLAICKRLAELMGGEVALYSQPGLGTTATLTVTLPTAKAEEAPARPAGPPAAEQPALIHNSGEPILFVEDNPTNRKLTMRQLERIGVACKVAENGQEAYALWLREPFSLVLTDCHMPVMDGHQLAQAIRAEEARTPGRPPVPIIACTANIGKDEAEHALASGMNEVLTKPIGLEPLREMLVRWLGQQPPAPAPTTTTADAPGPTDAMAAAGHDDDEPDDNGLDEGGLDDEAAEADTDDDLGPPIERERLAIYSEGNLEIELGIVGEFLSSEQEDLIGLRQAVADNNHEQARWFTHRIKGAGRMVGTLSLAEAAEALEIRAKQQADMTGDLERLERAFRAVERWQAAMTATLETGGAAG